MTDRAPLKTLPTDFRRSDLWATKVGFYMLWVEYLALSPSYELARLYQSGKLTPEQNKKLPEDFDKILAVFDDFGDVQRVLFLDWWRERGMELCGFRGEKPKVSKIAAIGKKREPTAATFDRVADYLNDDWIAQGSQNTLLVAVPIGLPKSRIAKEINALLDTYPKRDKVLSPPNPKYILAGKRQNKDMLFRYLHVLRFKALHPSLELWRLGVRSNVSDTYSPELEHDAKVIANEDSYDRMMLTILTSRAIQRGRLIAENAARGIFPSYSNCAHAVEFDYGETNKLFQSRYKWQKTQAAKTRR